LLFDACGFNNKMMIAMDGWMVLWQKQGSRSNKRGGVSFTENILLNKLWFGKRRHVHDD